MTDGRLAPVSDDGQDLELASGKLVAEVGLCRLPFDGLEPHTTIYDESLRHRYQNTGGACLRVAGKF